MVKKYLLDTNVIIDLFRGEEESRKLWEKLDLNQCCLSAVVTAEFFQGLFTEEKRKLQGSYYRQLVDDYEMPVIEFNETIAEKYGELQVEYLKKGKTRPIFGLMIAATAMVYDLELVTRNVADFEIIKGLKIYK